MLSCIIAACIILTNNIQVKALNTDNILHSTSTAPGQGSGWYQQNDNWYYKVDGKNVTQTFAYVNEKWYYFDKQGVMVHNSTINIAGKDYVFAEDGVCTNMDNNQEYNGWEWHYSDRKWYYYDENGVKLKNTIVDGFRIDANGARVESENNDSPDAYYVQGADGSLVDLNIEYDSTKEPGLSDGFYKQNDNWYLKKDNKNITGWVKHNNVWYYLDKQGAMVIDVSLKIDGKKYIFNKSGMCANKK